MNARLVVPAVIALHLMAVAAAEAQPPSAPKTVEPAVVARQFVDLLVKEDFAQAVKPFDDAMRAALPETKLKLTWKAVVLGAGPFKKVLGARSEKVQGIHVVILSSQFERIVLDLKVSVRSSGQIAGFFIAPGQSPVKYQPPAYATPESFREQEVTVGEGPWALHGTLTLPVGDGPFPALVLVQGSGPNDRDESVGANKPFRDLAWGLASRKIAVLRYEKRTKEHGDKLAKSLSTLTVKEETIDDALAAVALLRKTAKIDPRRMFVLGHSLGGMLLPRIGRQDPKIAGLVFLAGSTRRLEDIILAQTSYLAALDGRVSEEEKAGIELVRSEVAKIKALKPSDAGSSTSILGAPPAYWLDLDAYDPPAVARQLTCPMFFLQGERDYQVVEEDFQGWQKALQAHPGVTFRRYPRLNHLFIPGEGPPGPAEYDKPGHVAKEVVDDIAAWIEGH
jgi:dienelactone hydrolase